jgi:UDP-N-acetylglucosamine diphosphorylase/glucosamine-1-phosphate N-acetyltransferase
MNIIFFSEHKLLPFTYTRPVADLRVGILRIAEKWQKLLGLSDFSFSEDGLLSAFYERHYEGDNIYINANFCPASLRLNEIVKENKTFALMQGNSLVALRTDAHLFSNEEIFSFARRHKNSIQTTEAREISKIWHIFLHNGAEIQSDFALLTAGKTSAKIEDPYTRIYASENVFIEEGVKVKAAIINAENAKIYIGKNVSIEEGAIIKGNTALCEGATISPGAKLRGDNTVGVYSKVGGEMSNSVIWGYSNKGHEGFLGNSVIGAWCNLGADTNNSNLKNNYSPVRLWDIEAHAWQDTGQIFAGLFMGDHSKSGINTMFNTGTVVGIACNVFGADFPHKYIPSFSWGKNDTFRLNEVYEMAGNMMKRRGVSLSETEKKLLEKIFFLTYEDRRIFHSNSR